MEWVAKVEYGNTFYLEKVAEVDRDAAIVSALQSTRENNLLGRTHSLPLIALILFGLRMIQSSCGSQREA